MPNAYVRLFLVILLGTLSLGFSSQAKADMKWVETINGFCPTVCQKTDYKFAVPGGIHPPTKKLFYVCATNMVGWRIGFNIEWGATKGWCHAQWRRLTGPSSYGEHYFCLCTDQQMPPITDDMVKR